MIWILSVEILLILSSRISTIKDRRENES